MADKSEQLAIIYDAKLDSLLLRATGELPNISLSLLFFIFP